MTKKQTHPELEHWPLDRLIPYVRNPRKNDHAVKAIASAIQEFGFRVPILARSDGEVVDGHLRLKAAQLLGMETVPVLLCDDMTEAQVKAFRISVNRMADLAEWDMELLALEIEDLREINFDLAPLGFGVSEISNLVASIDTQVGKTNTNEEWDGMPDFDNAPTCFRKVVVSFDCQGDVDAFFALLGQRDTGKTKSIWFPAKERRDLEAQRWVTSNEQDQQPQEIDSDGE